jgi:hypothetical protein
LAEGGLNRANAEARRVEAFQEAKEVALGLGGRVYDGLIDRTGEEPRLPASLELLRVLPEDRVTLRIPRTGGGANTLVQSGALTFLVQEGLGLPPAWRGLAGQVRTLPGRVEEAEPMVEEAVQQGETVVLVLNTALVTRTEPWAALVANYDSVYGLRISPAELKNLDRPGDLATLLAIVRTAGRLFTLSDLRFDPDEQNTLLLTSRSL